MKYSYVVFPDNTEVTYGDINKNGNVAVRIETPAEGGFNSLGCMLPSCQVTELNGYSQREQDTLMDFLKHNAHLIIEFSRWGGFEKIQRNQ